MDDFTRNGLQYDLILDTVGNRSFRDLRRATTAKGTIVVAGGGGGRLFGPITQIVRALVLSPLVSQRVRVVMANVGKDDLVFLKGLVDEGKVTPVIDRAYPLSEAAEAVRYLEGRHARGKVVITV